MPATVAPAAHTAAPPPPTATTPESSTEAPCWTIRVHSESIRADQQQPYIDRRTDWHGPLEPTLAQALAERIRDPRLAAELQELIRAVIAASPLAHVLVRKRWQPDDGSRHTLVIELRDDASGVGEPWFEEL